MSSRSLTLDPAPESFLSVDVSEDRGAEGGISATTNVSLYLTHPLLSKDDVCPKDGSTWSRAACYVICKHKSHSILPIPTISAASVGRFCFAFDVESTGLKMPWKETVDFLVLGEDCWSLGISCLQHYRSQ